VVDSAVVEVDQAPLHRPGVLRRAAAGAWHVPAGFGLLLRNPSLWPLALLPTILAVLFLFGGFVLAVFALPTVESALAPETGTLPSWVSFILTLALWAGTLTAGVVLGLAVALLLTAPILERLSRRAEACILGVTLDRSAGLRWEVAQSLKTGAYFLAIAPLVLILGLVPVVGPFLAALWAAHAIALQETEAPLSRRGLGFQARRQWHRRWRAESLGFGLAAFLTLLVPVANILLAPALAVGGTMLVLDLSQGLEPVASVPSPVEAPVEH